MLNLLIIDDEESVREALKSIIKWEEYGFKICGEAENGIDGLNMIIDLNPDLVIADIRMPGLDGLQMIKVMKEKGLECKVIILTGCSEFQYARQSIELGVASYLLKPIDEEELIAQIKKIHKSMLEEKRIKDYLTDSIFSSGDKLIESLISGHPDDVIITKANKLYNFDLPWKTYQVLLIDLDGTVPMEKNLRANLKKALNNIVPNSWHTFENDGKIGVLLKDVNLDLNTRQLENIRKAAQGSPGIDTVIAVGPCVTEIDKISLSYKYAFDLLKNKFIWGSKKIVLYNKDIIDDLYIQHQEIDTEYIIEKLYITIDINNKENISSLLRELSRNFLTQSSTEESIKLNFIKAYITIINKLMLSKKSLGAYSQIDSMYGKRNLDELMQYIEDRLTAISDEISNINADTPIKKIIDFINRNYCQDIRIENLAQIFGYSSTYLGQLFKNYTGMYFNTYLETKRIEKAKQFLKEGFKVYQVVEKVGYHDLDYFSNKFKKYVGVTPSAFKEA